MLWLGQPVRCLRHAPASDPWRALIWPDLPVPAVLFDFCSIVVIERSTSCNRVHSRHCSRLVISRNSPMTDAARTSAGNWALLCSRAGVHVRTKALLRFWTKDYRRMAVRQAPSLMFPRAHPGAPPARGADDRYTRTIDVNLTDCAGDPRQEDGKGRHAAKERDESRSRRPWLRLLDVRCVREVSMLGGPQAYIFF